jgi:ComEC/Rec2-related protein
MTKNSILTFLNKFIFFNHQYYRHHLFFLVFFIFGAASYLKFFLLRPNFLIINFLIFFGISILIFFSNKFHEKYFLKIHKFDFFTLNGIYILYLLFFFTLGFLIPNCHSKIFFEKKALQIEEKISFQGKKLFQIEDIAKFDLEKGFICLILKEFFDEKNNFGENGAQNQKRFFEKNAKIRFCSHFPRIKKIENNFRIKDSILMVENFEINPIKDQIFPYDYQIKRGYFFRNIIGEVYSNHVEILKNESNFASFSMKINDFRYTNSLKIIKTFGIENGSLISALVFGTRIFVSKEINENMRKSSMLHLIAISGLHISFISILFFRFIFLILLLLAFNFCKNIPYFFLKKISLFVSLFAGLSYLVISGFSISAQRAFLMFFVYIFYSFFGWQVIFSKTIFISALLLVFLNPVEILSPGLQMSFFAVIGLFLFFHSNYQKKLLDLILKIRLSIWIQKSIHFFGKIVSGSFGPHFLTMPISAFYFSQITTYTFLANILAVPLMSLIIAPLIITYLVLNFFNFQNLNHFIGIGINFSFLILKKISKFFADSAPFNSLYIDQIPTRSFICFLLALSMLFIWREKIKFAFFSLFFILGIMFVGFEKTIPDFFILQEKNSIHYFCFDKSKLNIYFFIKNPKDKKKNSQKVNYFLNQRFGQKYNFIRVSEKDFGDLQKNLISKKKISKIGWQKNSVSIFLK